MKVGSGIGGGYLCRHAKSRYKVDVYLDIQEVDVRVVV